MKHNRFFINLFLYSGLTFLFFGFSTDVWAAPKKPEKAAPKKDDQKKPENDKKDKESDELEKFMLTSIGTRQMLQERNSFSGKYKPHLGIMFQPLVALGEVGSVVNAGIISMQISGGFQFYGEESGLLIRSGFSAGFANFASKKIFENTGNLTLIPILIRNYFIYSLKMSNSLVFLPRASIGLGATMSSSVVDVYGRTKSQSSIDGTFTLGFGAGMQLASMKNIEYFFDINYLMAFESLNGSFVGMAIGIGYFF